MLGRTNNNNRIIENRPRAVKTAPPKPRRKRWKNNPNNLEGYNTYDVEIDEKSIMRFVLGAGIILIAAGTTMTCVSYGVTDSPFSTKFMGPFLIVIGILFIGLNRIINFNLNYDNEFLRRSRECSPKPNAPQIQRTTALELGFQRIPGDDPEIESIQDDPGEGTSIMGANGGCRISTINETAGEGTSRMELTRSEGISTMSATGGEGTSTMSATGGEGTSTMSATGGKSSSAMYTTAGEGTSAFGATDGKETSTMFATAYEVTRTREPTRREAIIGMKETGGEGSCDLQMMELQLYTSLSDNDLDDDHLDEELASLCSSDITVYEARV